MYSYLAKFTLVLLVVTAPCQASVANDNNGKLPNILLIMADDLGYNDLHIYNGNPLAHTPSIDQLAREGVRFTRHYTDAVCEPSRMALLTGLFPARLSGRSGSRGISLDVVTIADSLGAAGYRTHHIGKWHVRASVRDAWPDRQGFGSYFGFINQLLLDGIRQLLRIHKSTAAGWQTGGRETRVWPIALPGSLAERKRGTRPRI
jgi:hypothetical protein